MGLEKLRDIPIFNKYTLTYTSNINIASFFKSISSWFSTRGYDFWETGIGEKDIGTGGLVDSDWKAIKEVTDYVQFELVIKVWIRDLRKVTLENGEETYWGRIYIRMDSIMHKDYKKRFDNNKKMQELMRQLYERYIAKEEVDSYMDKLYFEASDLIDLFRSKMS